MSGGVKKFMYFAYGSNLLASRIHVNNPSAARVGMGKVLNFRLDFNTQTKRWRGAAATIVNEQGAEVWGAVWELNIEHQATLDEQEGVSMGIYRALNVDVLMNGDSGDSRSCRVYQQVATIGEVCALDALPAPRRPSKIYMDIIQRGAVESDLPQAYRTQLARVLHNDFNGPIDLKEPN